MSFAAESDDSVFDLRRMISDGTKLPREAVRFQCRTCLPALCVMKVRDLESE